MGDVEKLEKKMLQRFGILLFVGNAILYSMRVNLSVAIVAMAKGTISTARSSSPGLEDTCPEPELLTDSARKADDGEFDWDDNRQGLVLGAFFFGYLSTNFVGGLLAERVGGRVVYGWGMLLTAVMTLLSPLAARLSTRAFVACRVGAGMAEGVFFPALSVIVARWVPVWQRPAFLSYTVSGCQLGVLLTMAVTGWLCDSLAGWPSAFYVFGVLALLWGCAWQWLLAEYPDSCNPLWCPASESKAKVSPTPPWGSILSSVPFLSVVVAHTCGNWGFYCLLTEMPSYLSHVLHFDVHTNGVVSGLPYLCKWAVMLWWPQVVHNAITTGRITTANARRLSSFIGMVVPALLLLVCLPLAGCSRGLVVLTLCLAVGVSGTDFCGHLASLQELAPNYAGTLTGLSNTVATLPGFLAPQVTGMLLTDHSSRSSWNSVFTLAAALYVVGTCVYVTYMSPVVQSWNTHSKRSENRQSLLDVRDM